MNDIYVGTLGHALVAVCGVVVAAHRLVCFGRVCAVTHCMGTKIVSMHIGITIIYAVTLKYCIT